MRSTLEQQIHELVNAAKRAGQTSGVATAEAAREAAECRDQLQASQVELLRRQEALEKSQHVVEELGASLAEVRAKADQAHEQRRTAEEEAARLRDSLGGGLAASAEARTARAEAATLREELATAKKEAARLQEELVMANATVEAVKVEAAKAEAAKAGAGAAEAAMTEVMGLRDELAAAKAEIAQLKRGSSSAGEENARLIAQVAQLEATKIELAEVMSSLKDTFTALDIQVEENQTLTDYVTELGDQATRARSELHAAQTELTDMINTLDIKLAENQTLAQQVKAISKSLEVATREALNAAEMREQLAVLKAQRQLDVQRLEGEAARLRSMCSQFHNELRQCQSALGEALGSVGDLCADNGMLSGKVQELAQKYKHTRSTVSALGAQLHDAIDATEAAIKLKDDTVVEMRRVAGEAQARVAMIEDASRLDRAALINAALRSLHHMRAQVAAIAAFLPAPQIQEQDHAPLLSPLAKSAVPTRPPRTAASTLSGASKSRRDPFIFTTAPLPAHHLDSASGSSLLIPQAEQHSRMPQHGLARQWQPRGQVTVLNLEHRNGEVGITTDALRSHKHRWGTPAPPTNTGAAAEADAILQSPLLLETRTASMTAHRAPVSPVSVPLTVPASPQGGALPQHTTSPVSPISPRAAKGRLTMAPAYQQSAQQGATPFSQAVEAGLRSQDRQDGAAVDTSSACTLPRLTACQQNTCCGASRSQADVAPSASPAVRAFMYPP